MKAKGLVGLIVLVVVTVAGSRWKSHSQGVAAKPASPQPLRAEATMPEGAVRFDDLPAAPEAALLQSPLRPGDIAPDFTLPDQKGQIHRLSELGGKTVVLSFYPQDFTYMCTAQAVSLTHSQPEFLTRNAVVFGVSVQPVASKQHFAGRYGIAYPLLADSERIVARKYRVLNKDGLAGRVTFIIGPIGTILSTDQRVHAETHAQDVLHTLDRLQSHHFPLQPHRQIQSTRFPFR